MISARTIPLLKAVLVVHLVCIVSLNAQDAPKDAPEDHFIRFHRPMAAGDTVLFSAAAQFKLVTDTSLNAVKVNTVVQNVAIDFEGVATVRKINERGRPISMNFKVERCDIVEGEGEKELSLRKGTNIDVYYKNERLVHDVDGPKLNEAQRTILRLILQVVHPDAPTDDDIMFTIRRRRIGETWEINQDLAADAIRLSLPDEAENVKVFGVARLEGKNPIDDVDCFQVAVGRKVEGLKIELPAEIEEHTASEQMRSTFWLPVDPRITDFMEMYIENRTTLTGFGSSPNGRVQIDRQVDLKGVSSVRPVPADE